MNTGSYKKALGELLNYPHLKIRNKAWLPAFAFLFDVAAKLEKGEMSFKVT